MAARRITIMDLLLIALIEFRDLLGVFFCMLVDPQSYWFLFFSLLYVFAPYWPSTVFLALSATLLRAASHVQ